ncbi:PIG-L family deacetylase [Cellulosimicrobium cellulans]|uniref:PIG-L deacetylase family protein n=1 Tax=Cellulosimicrobium cellulans TaxID=1710 RepID=UPI0028AAA810|nr:PIG-L family deacetylase [Cellulosimicrobium cellulans]
MLFRTPVDGVTVLALGAHPDDIEIGCGGTLLTLAGTGRAEIATLVLTGTDDREAEARAAAQAFGVGSGPTFVGLPDARLPAHWSAVKDALHAFREAHPVPDLVLAPRPDDAHQDHALLGRLVTTVWRGPTILHYEIPKWDGDLARPTVYVPLDPAVVDRKITLLDRVFPSQRTRDWWDDEFFRSILRLRGAEARTRYAEGFVADKIELEIV